MNRNLPGAVPEPKKIISHINIVLSYVLFSSHMINLTNEITILLCRIFFLKSGLVGGSGTAPRMLCSNTRKRFSDMRDVLTPQLVLYELHDFDYWSVQDWQTSFQFSFRLSYSFKVNWGTVNPYSARQKRGHFSIELLPPAPLLVPCKKWLVQFTRLK